jgi:hypothetical protein
VQPLTINRGDCCNRPTETACRPLRRTSTCLSRN